MNLHLLSLLGVPKDAICLECIARAAMAGLPTVAL